MEPNSRGLQQLRRASDEGCSGNSLFASTKKPTQGLGRHAFPRLEPDLLDCLKRMINCEPLALGDRTESFHDQHANVGSLSNDLAFDAPNVCLGRNRGHGRVQAWA